MSRARHLEEMRLALAEGVSLKEAARRLAMLRWRADQNARQPVIFGLDRGLQGDRTVTAEVTQTDTGHKFWWQQ